LLADQSLFVGVIPAAAATGRCASSTTRKSLFRLALFIRMTVVAFEYRTELPSFGIVFAHPQLDEAGAKSWTEGNRHYDNRITQYLIRYSISANLMRA
jgi:hypothetical protein